MKKLKLIAFLFGFLILQSSTAHKFYMSQINMWYNFDTFSLEIIIDLFVDDLEKEIEISHGKKLFIGTAKEHPDADSLIFSYIKDHFTLSQQDTLSPMSYVGKELKTEQLLVYIESKNFKDDQPLEVKVDLLTEVFEEQVNRINYENEDLTQSASLTKDKTQTKFKSPY